MNTTVSAKTNPEVSDTENRNGMAKVSQIILRDSYHIQGVERVQIELVNTKGKYLRGLTVIEKSAMIELCQKFLEANGYTVSRQRPTVLVHLREGLLEQIMVDTPVILYYADDDANSSVEPIIFRQVTDENTLKQVSPEQMQLHLEAWEEQRQASEAESIDDEPEEDRICKCGHPASKHGDQIGHLSSLRCTEPGCTCWEWEKPTYNFGETPKEIIVAAVQLTGQHYPCDLRGAEARVMCAVVNQGIDSYLEAITSSAFTGNDAYLECNISAEDMPVILRRMQEMSDNQDEDAELLRSAILETLGIEEI